MRSARNVVSFGVPALKSVSELTVVHIFVLQVSLRMIRPVSVLIPSVSRELVAIVVCRPPPPHKFSMLRSSFTFAVCNAFWSSVNVEISILQSPPAIANTVFTSAGLRRFGILSSRSAGDNGRAGFGICGSGIYIDVSATAPEDEELCCGSRTTSWG